METRLTRFSDLTEVLSRASQEALLDLRVFGLSNYDAFEKLKDAYPFSWTITNNDIPECLCWYNREGNKAVTTMLYTDTFLLNKGVTNRVKRVIDDNQRIAKEGGLEKVECHSHLLNPLSESWYLKLGFRKTKETYKVNGHTIFVFERIL